jgi:metal transporter CNNM
LVSIHGEDQKVLTIDETTIIQGALDMKHKTVKDCMSPIEKLFMLDINQRMDKRTMKEVICNGDLRVTRYR